MLYFYHLANNQILINYLKYIKIKHKKSWEDVTCESSSHSVCGSFYTDKQENLHVGYPC